jgi:dihydrofolate reductase
MRRIRVFAHVSLDGVIAPSGPGVDAGMASGGWMMPYRSPEGAAALAEVQGSGFDLLLGRRTYDLWAGHWPKATGGPFADAYNAATKHVVTRRAEGLAWGPASAIGGDVVEGVRRLKTAGGPDLVVWGSTTVTSRLIEAGLVEELVLAVCPVLLGRGTRLFADEALPRALELVSTRATPTGVLLTVYRHVGSLRDKIAPAPASR